MIVLRTLQFSSPCRSDFNNSKDGESYPFYVQPFPCGRYLRSRDPKKVYQRWRLGRIRVLSHDVSAGSELCCYRRVRSSRQPHRSSIPCPSLGLSQRNCTSVVHVSHSEMRFYLFSIDVHSLKTSLSQSAKFSAAYIPTAFQSQNPTSSVFPSTSLA